MLSKKSFEEKIKDADAEMELDENLTDDSAEEDANFYYKVLENNGQLIDIDAKTDVTDLPPNITHVRYPDGRVERIGFA